MQWSPQQAQAIDAVSKWLKDPHAPQVFKLFGFAGTGKSSLAIELSQGLGPQVKFAAFTGKAALQMRLKGCPDASTLHSLIYKVEDPEAAVPTFVVNPDSQLRHAKLLVLDEVGMLNKEMSEDALSFGTKVLVLGDPGQLPPIDGTGYFTVGKPDVMLTEIHRQAADNPILHLATLARTRQRIPPGKYGDCVVVGRAKADRDWLGQQVVEADQVLCGKNATRHTYNHRIRQLRSLEGQIEPWHPEVGDKLVCLRNDNKKHYLNGSLWDVESVMTDGDTASFRLASLDDGSDLTIAYPTVPMEFFEGTEDKMNFYRRKSYDEFCYGWALTVHKSQGSQWPNVTIFDESMIFREHRYKHLYTAITRASERLTLIL